MTDHESLGKSIVSTGVLTSLAACGGGGGGGGASGGESDIGRLHVYPQESIGTYVPQAEDIAIIRFLHQASFGPTPNLVMDVKRVGIEGWLEQQMQMERRISLRKTLAANIAPRRPGEKKNTWALDMPKLFLQQAVCEKAQLRCRVAFALSEIVVYSYSGSANTAGAASVNDVFQEGAFGNYKDILYKFSRTTAVAGFLTFLSSSENVHDPNFKPDENYARELMQLFTLGVYELNLDGTQKLDSAGKPIPTFGPSDIYGLSKIFTGNKIGYDEVNKHWDATFDTWVSQRHHIEGPKAFLGKTVHRPGDMLAELKDAIDILVNHPNVGPHLAHRLITRLITSNPSPAYVKRVASVFNDNGKNVRGDLAAVIHAIYLDPEARDLKKQSDPNFGKYREPILMLTNFLRISDSGLDDNSKKQGKIWEYFEQALADPLNGLSQNPWCAPDVFNYFDAEFAYPGSEVDQRNLIAPESQLFTSISVIGMLNFIVERIKNKPLKLTNITARYFYLQTLAHSPQLLVDTLVCYLTSNSMPVELKQKIVTAVDEVKMPNSIDAKAVNDAITKRICTALIIIMCSPFYIVQR